jgi:hypothetical protein
MAGGITYSDVNKSRPMWMGDYAHAREAILAVPAKLDVAAFRAVDAVVVVVGAAGALVDATSVPVDALSGPLPSGTVLDFGAKKFAQLTAPAVAGATAITVEALATALVDNDTATYAGDPTKAKSIPSGTLIGRTYAERDAGDPWGPAASTDDEIYLTAFEVVDTRLRDEGELYRHGRLVKENFLPNWSTMGTTLQNVIRARYTCIVGLP